MPSPRSEPFCVRIIRRPMIPVPPTLKFNVSANIIGAPIPVNLGMYKLWRTSKIRFCLDRRSPSWLDHLIIIMLRTHLLSFIMNTHYITMLPPAAFTVSDPSRNAMVFPLDTSSSKRTRSSCWTEWHFEAIGGFRIAIAPPWLCLLDWPLHIAKVVLGEFVELM